MKLPAGRSRRDRPPFIDASKGAIPKGYCRIAQGCRAAATLGARFDNAFTPKGLRNGGAPLRNPFRVAEPARDPCPRVAATLAFAATLGYLTQALWANSNLKTGCGSTRRRTIS